MTLLTENPKGLKFCNHCGTPLKSMARCAKCGFDNAPGARFCGECGGGLSAAVQAKSLDIESVRATADSQDLALLCPR
jgi:predicted amidophosphoribosyltransferase